MDSDSTEAPLRGCKRSLSEECLDTKTWRMDRSLTWVGFHTYKESQCPELRVWRLDCVMMSPQVLLDCRGVKANKRTGVSGGRKERTEHSSGSVQDVHEDTLCVLVACFC